MDNKIKFDWKHFDWKHFLFFFALTGGILYLTKSFLMSLGILLLLFVVDHYLQLLDEWLKERHDRKQEEQE